MQIFLNGKEVQFTPNGERYLSDVLTKLKNWMEGNGFFIESLSVDNTNYDNHNMEQFCNIKLEDVNRIDVEAFSRLELEFIQYSVVRNYFNAIIEAIDKNDSTALKSLADEYDEIQQTLSLTVKFAQDDEDRLVALLKAPLDGQNVQEIRNAAASIAKLCQEGLDELQKYAENDKKESLD